MATTPPRPRNGLAVTSAILGVISVLTLLLMIGFFVALAAIATGWKALRRVKRGEATRRAPAVLGIVLGLVTVLVSVSLVFLGAEQSKTGCWPFPEHTGCY